MHPYSHKTDALTSTAYATRTQIKLHARVMHAHGQDRVTVNTYEYSPIFILLFYSLYGNVYKLC